jgi:hypothetical protein
MTIASPGVVWWFAACPTIDAFSRIVVRGSLMIIASPGVVWRFAACTTIDASLRRTDIV